MPLPANAKVIYEWLTGHGYSDNAAAGILGNMEQESGGNPESVGTGGNGLIGFTPARPGIVTGNTQVDLAKQLPMVNAYNHQNGNISVLNSKGSASAAAIYYMSTFERPAPATENEANRVSSADAVIQAAKSGNWSGSGSTLGGSASAPVSSDIFSGIGGDLVNGLLAQFGINSLADFIERALLILFGLILLIVGVVKIAGGPSGSKNPVSNIRSAKSEGDSEVESDSDDTADAVEDYSDKPYKSAKGKAKYEEYQDRETEKAYNKKAIHSREEMAADDSGSASAFQKMKSSGMVKTLAKEAPMAAEIPF
jgi:hypothetical protein